MVRLAASIGLRRIPKSRARNVAQATRNMRKQLKALSDNLLKAIQHIEDITPDALEKAMMPIFEESQRLVPKDTLKLMRSGFINKSAFRGLPTVNIGYALGNNPLYAIIVHEDMNATHRNGTQAKFLEQPFKKHVRSIAASVARIIKRNAKT